MPTITLSRGQLIWGQIWEPIRIRYFWCFTELDSASAVRWPASVRKLAAFQPLFGAQGDFAGLDQVNIQIPRSLAGRGEVDLILTVDGVAANVVRISIK
jgi:hypothetical protein